MRTVTVCCHGTGYDSHRANAEGELVDWFYRNIAGGEISMSKGVVQNVTNGTRILLSGPGSATEPGTFTTPVLQPNMVNPKTGDQRNHRWMTKQEHRVLGTVVNTLAGTTGGHGWNTNVKLAMNLLQRAHSANPIGRINMIGWSRGAVTCIKLANELFGPPWSNAIECNIFAVDPVAGTSKGTKDKHRTLNTNVKNYVSTLAMHEQRKWFKVQDAERIVASPTTRCVMLPMPGRHNTAPVGDSDVAKVTGNLACAFLSKFGTGLNATHSAGLSGMGEMVAAYARMIVGFDGYAQGADTAGQKLMGGGLEPRAFLQNLKQYQKCDYWINEHHRRCFKKDYSRVYDFMFHQPQGTDMKDITTIDRGFAYLLRSNQGTAIRSSLISNGLLGSQGNNLVTFQGIGRNRPAGVSSDVMYKWPGDDLPIRA